MCEAVAYKSTLCRHRWLTITKPCAPRFGFTTPPCPDIKCSSTNMCGEAKYMKASANSCPSCDLKGQYNANTTRMLYSNHGCASSWMPYAQPNGLYINDPYTAGNYARVHNTLATPQYPQMYLSHPGPMCCTIL